MNQIILKYDVNSSVIWVHGRRDWSNIKVGGRKCYLEQDVIETYKYKEFVAKGIYLSSTDAEEQLGKSKKSIFLLARRMNWKIIRGDHGQYYYPTADILSWVSSPEGYLSRREIEEIYSVSNSVTKHFSKTDHWGSVYHHGKVFFLRSNVETSLTKPDILNSNLVSVEEGMDYLGVSREKFIRLARQYKIHSVRSRYGIFYDFNDITNYRKNNIPKDL